MAETRIDELRRRLEREPGSRLFAQLAEEHRKAGDPGEAIRVARAGLQVHPSYTSARLTLGRALLDAGEPGGARTELTEVLREAPDNILASRFLGQALEMAGDVAGALLQYTATLRMAPGDRQLEAHVAALQGRLGQPRAGEGAAPMRAAAPPLPAGVAAQLAGPNAPSGSPSGVPPPLPRPPVPPPPPTDRMAGAEGGSPGPGAGHPRPAPAEGPPGVSSPVAAPTGTPLPSAEPLPEDEDDTLTSATVALLDPGGLSGTLPVAAGAETPADPPAPPNGVAEMQPAPSAPADDPASTAAFTAVPAASSPGPTAPTEAEAPMATAPALSSSTLAELYLRQGLTERAREVYREVLADDPANERARAGLRELETATTGAAPADERSLRRAALQRTIAALEGMLSAVRRT